MSWLVVRVRQLVVAYDGSQVRLGVVNSEEGVTFETGEGPIAKAARSRGASKLLDKKIVTRVKKRPGIMAKDISIAMGVGLRKLSMPLRRLLSSGQLTRTGIKRHTRYFLSS
jgi:hypothetical protein